MQLHSLLAGPQKPPRVSQSVKCYEVANVRGHKPAHVTEALGKVPAACATCILGSLVATGVVLATEAGNLLHVSAFNLALSPKLQRHVQEIQAACALSARLFLLCVLMLVSWLSCRCPKQSYFIRDRGSSGAGASAGLLTDSCSKAWTGTLSAPSDTRAAFKCRQRCQQTP